MPGRELQDHRRVEQMDLYYKSTRNSNLKVTASEAILKGLAPDGGLFVFVIGISLNLPLGQALFLLENNPYRLILSGM